jgi:hypothetical protein
MVSTLYDRHEDGVAKHAVDQARIAYNPLSDEPRLFIEGDGAWIVGVHIELDAFEARAPRLG